LYIILEKVPGHGNGEQFSMKFPTKLITALGVLVALTGASHAQSLTNGTFTSGLAPWVAGGLGTIAGTGGISNDSFSVAGNYYYLNGAPGQVIGLSQSFTLGSPLAVNISGLYTSIGIGTGTNSFVIQVLDSANTVLHQQTFNPTSTGYVANWKPFSTTTGTLVGGTYKVLVIGQGNGFDDDYGVDNISATAANVVAPEPGSLALLGLAAIPGIGLLRRKK
jgi:hypothetical protein